MAAAVVIIIPATVSPATSFLFSRCAMANPRFFCDFRWDALGLSCPRWSAYHCSTAVTCFYPRLPALARPPDARGAAR